MLLVSSQAFHNMFKGLRPKTSELELSVQRHKNEVMMSCSEVNRLNGVVANLEAESLSSL